MEIRKNKNKISFLSGKNVMEVEYGEDNSMIARCGDLEFVYPGEYEVGEFSFQANEISRDKNWEGKINYIFVANVESSAMFVSVDESFEEVAFEGYLDDVTSADLIISKNCSKELISFLQKRLQARDVLLLDAKDVVGVYEDSFNIQKEPISKFKIESNEEEENESSIVSLHILQ